MSQWKSSREQWLVVQRSKSDSTEVEKGKVALFFITSFVVFLLFYCQGAGDQLPICRVWCQFIAVSCPFVAFAPRMRLTLCMTGICLWCWDIFGTPKSLDSDRKESKMWLCLLSSFSTVSLFHVYVHLFHFFIRIYLNHCNLFYDNMRGACRWLLKAAPWCCCHSLFPEMGKKDTGNNVGCGRDVKIYIYNHIDISLRYGEVSHFKIF